MMGLQQLNKLPPGSNLRLRRVRVLEALSGCKATRGPHRGGPSTVQTKLDLPTRGETSPIPFPCSRCSCTSQAPLAPFLNPCSGERWGSLQGGYSRLVHGLPVTQRDSGAGTEGAAVAPGALPGVSGPGCLTQR